jgi:hypothetical protein
MRDNYPRAGGQQGGDCEDGKEIKTAELKMAVWNRRRSLWKIRRNAFNF